MARSFPRRAAEYAILQVQNDRGNAVRGASWERMGSWEVAGDGEAIKVERT